MPSAGLQVIAADAQAGISNYHDDSTMIMVSYELYCAIRIALNKLYARDVGRLTTCRPLVNGRFPSQRASNAENNSMSCRHHVFSCCHTVHHVKIDATRLSFPRPNFPQSMSVLLCRLLTRHSLILGDLAPSVSTITRSNNHSLQCYARNYCRNRQ